MASGLPVPEPPGTPTPPPEDRREDEEVNGADAQSAVFGIGLGVQGWRHSSNSSLPSIDRSSLYPMDETKLGHVESMLSLKPSTPSLLTPDAADSPIDVAVEGSFETGRNPFGYQTTTYNVGGRSPSKSVRRISILMSPDVLYNDRIADELKHMGFRRGHKYKHSSVSHQIFLEPEPKAPLRLPASLPIPTAREGYTSMTRDQKLRLAWCFLHLFVAAYVQWAAQGSLAVTALSHLIFYDAIGAFLCAGVEVLGNFEVWKRSSIRQPFGLERSEVLVGFAMSILLLFMGFDLISHNVGHVLESSGNHEPHHAHSHTKSDRVSPGSVDTVSLLAIASTLVSAFMLQNHARLAKAMQLGSMALLPSILANPSHLLTLSCSSLLLLLPLLSFEMYTWLDRALSGSMALAMCLLGYQLVKTLGAMLLMSHSSADGVADVIRDIEKDSAVTEVEEAKFWQVHYGLCMANLKLRVRGTEESMLRLRERIASLVKNRLGGGFGGGGAAQNWEVSAQLIVEKA
ncbi:MAG: Endoplasmic reticulum zinc transporter [Chrysothrix sp. TS-e1954]|nr:MAG: Endoplasmic reticulum zinc transporter [Chrysothrix sp. TS-e1954]